MRKATGSFTSLFAGISGGVFILILPAGFLLDAPGFYAIVLGYLLSFLFVGSNLLVVRKLDLEDHQRFYRIFFISVSLRFILVVASIVFVLKMIKIQQIYFTVSFIISYIFHSIIEIIFINKILKTDN